MVSVECNGEEDELRKYETGMYEVVWCWIHDTESGDEHLGLTFRFRKQFDYLLTDDLAPSRVQHDSAF